MGTGTFLFWQTLLVITWITINLVAVSYRWDPYPFILLNLAFSTQAAYAAPLILLAQNRQDDRDRITLDEDRNRAAQTKADTEFLARELAALRVAIGEVATRDYLRGELDRLRVDLEEMTNPDAADPTAQRPPDTAKNRKPRASRCTAETAAGAGQENRGSATPRPPADAVRRPPEKKTRCRRPAADRGIAPHEDLDTQLLAAALTERGIGSTHRAVDASSPTCRRRSRHRSHHLGLHLSPGRVPRFLHACRCPVANPPEVTRWNSHKGYLAELGAAGSRWCR